MRNVGCGASYVGWVESSRPTRRNAWSLPRGSRRLDPPYSLSLRKEGRRTTRQCGMSVAALAALEAVHAAEIDLVEAEGLEHLDAGLVALHGLGLDHPEVLLLEVAQDLGHEE